MAEPEHIPTTGITGIEDALLAALQGDPALAAVARHIGSWQGELETAIEQNAFRDPAILVLFGGFDTSPRGGHEALDVEWQILVRARNLRREAARRVGGPVSGEVGTYELVQHVMRILTGSDLDLDGVDELRLVACRLLQTGRDPSQTTSAYLVVFKVDADLLAVAPEQTLDELELNLEVHNPDEAGGDVSWVPSVDLTLDLTEES